MPVRVMKLIGVETLIATNAGGGLNNMFTVIDTETTPKNTFHIGQLNFHVVGQSKQLLLFALAGDLKEQSLSILSPCSVLTS